MVLIEENMEKIHDVVGRQRWTFPNSTTLMFVFGLTPATHFFSCAILLEDSKWQLLRYTCKKVLLISTRFPSWRILSQLEHSVRRCGD
jgi:hypothetical protein